MCQLLIGQNWAACGQDNTLDTRVIIFHSYRDITQGVLRLATAMGVSEGAIIGINSKDFAFQALCPRCAQKVVPSRLRADVLKFTCTCRVAPGGEQVTLVVERLVHQGVYLQGAPPAPAHLDSVAPLA